MLKKLCWIDKRKQIDKKMGVTLSRFAARIDAEPAVRREIEWFSQIVES
jgi:hypothetical protein